MKSIRSAVYRFALSAGLPVAEDSCTRLIQFKKQQLHNTEIEKTPKRFTFVDELHSSYFATTTPPIPTNQYTLRASNRKLHGRQLHPDLPCPRLRNQRHDPMEAIRLRTGSATALYQATNTFNYDNQHVRPQSERRS